jgi:hypothetical protein
MKGFYYLAGMFLITIGWAILANYILSIISRLTRNLHISETVRRGFARTYIVVVIIVWALVLLLFLKNPIIETINNILNSSVYNKVVGIIVILILIKFFIQDIKQAVTIEGAFLSAISKFAKVYLLMMLIIIVTYVFMALNLSFIIGAYTKSNMPATQLWYSLVCTIVAHAIIIRIGAKYLIPTENYIEKLIWLLKIVIVWIPLVYGKIAIPLIGIDFIIDKEVFKAFTNKDLIWMFTIVMVSHIEVVPKLLLEVVKKTWKTLFPTNSRELDI